MRRDPIGMLALICFTLALAILIGWGQIGHHWRKAMPPSHGDNCPMTQQPPREIA